MLKFKQYLNEQRLVFTDMKQLTDAVKEYHEAGEILNPEYQELVYQAKKLFKQYIRVHENFIDSVVMPLRDEDLFDLRWLWHWGESLTDVNKMAKLLPKIEKKNLNVSGMDKVIALSKQYVADWKPIADDIKSLKDKAVKVTTKRAEAKATAAKAMEKKFKNSSTLIKLLESHLDEYKQMARKRAEEFVKDKMNELKKYGWDLNLAAPVPKMRDGREAYQIAVQKQSLLSALTSPTESVISPGAPRIRKPNPAAAAKYVNDAVKGAEDSYRAFMQKMIEKIGKPVAKAKMSGNIWTDATITVTTDDGEDQVWSTRMILNFSKYQRMFNQFPSRRKK